MERSAYPVLIVDDEVSILNALKRELCAIAPVMVETDPHVAVKILEKHTISVLISDYRMKGTDGIAFMEGLSGLGYEPVKILMTAYSELDLVIDAVNRAGIYAFIKKPWDGKELRVIVKRAVEFFVTGNELGYYKKRLDEIETIKKGITSLLAHELRTPLTSISGYAELIENSASDEQTRAMAVSLRNGVRRLMAFTDDVIGISRIESGIQSGNNRVFGIAGILKSILDIDLKNSDASVNADMDDFTESLQKLKLFILKNGFTDTSECTEHDDFIFVNFPAEAEHVNHGIKQLSLFEGMEPNDEIVNYDGNHGLEIVFAQKFFKSIGGNLLFVESDKTKRLELAIPLAATVSRQGA
ncbi:MAG: response regulator [Oligoflexia bacterium]|nr:response regulator [Oligoflexia bacterium]